MRIPLFLLATLHLAAAAIAQQPGLNMAIELNGVDGYGSAAGVGGLYANSTWEAWVRFPSYDPSNTGIRAVLFRWGLYSHSAPMISAETGAAGAGGPSCPGGAETAPGAITPGIWHHVAAVYESQPGPAVVYVDGIEVARNNAGAACGPQSGWQTLLGAQGYIGLSQYLHAEIDEARISDTVRYHGLFTPQLLFAPDAHTLGLWHFDEGSGSVAHDSSGNGRDFALFGGYAWVPSFPVPAATFSPFGVGCPGSAGIPTLAAAPTSLPHLGTAFTLRFSNLPNTISLVVPFFGFSNTNWNGLPLPQDLAGFGMPGCTQYVDPWRIDFALDLTGSVDWNLTIPMLPVLAGATVYFQAVICDGSANNAFGGTTTNAGVAVVGW